MKKTKLIGLRIEDPLDALAKALEIQICEGESLSEAEGDHLWKMVFPEVEMYALRAYQDENTILDYLLVFQNEEDLVQFKLTYL